jgi:GDPmannose 4,6-dehydratase
MKKIALIFGVTGQDGSYLSRFLLKKKYKVHGVIRRSSSFNTQRIDDIYQDYFKKNKNFFLHYGDLADSSSIKQIIYKTKPSEIYNLGAQSHVKVSFEVPEYTADVNALGTLRILEALKGDKKLNKIKFYQASTSEMFGNINKRKKNENTAFYPRSPYGASKLYSYWITRNYREAYNLFAVNGILFNHESPLRGETFVTKKIVKALCRIKNLKQKYLILGNLYSKRDWGHAEDYVDAMWRMLQVKKPEDYVIATGKTYTIKHFVNLVCEKLKIKIKWHGKGLQECAFNDLGKKIIKIDKKYFRPTEVDYLLGDYSKAKKNLKWFPKKNINQLIDDMIDYEMKKNYD